MKLKLTLRTGEVREYDAGRYETSAHGVVTVYLNDGSVRHFSNDQIVSIETRSEDFQR